MDHVAVLDIGKTNVKLSVASADGTIVESLTTSNEPLPGPPYLHFDAEGIEDWFLDRLREMANRYPIGATVTTAHGSLGGLVGGDSLLMPMVDYENECPDDLNRQYREQAGALAERGSPIMPGFAHLARQLLFLETEWPAVVDEAQYFLGAPQYFAWRLTGVASSELTYLGAQSHLWDVRHGRYLPIVERRGWQRLMAPLKPAWQNLGAIRDDLRRRHDLPDGIAVLCGIHDSSANFYRYQQADLADIALFSTGTWIVGLGPMSRRPELEMTETVMCNADVRGEPLAGVLTMGGREFATLAGSAVDSQATLADIVAVVEDGTMALPSFGDHDVLFPGTAGLGRIVGPPPSSSQARRALALLYVSLLTDACLDVLGDNPTIVLDGSFVKDPLYPSLMAALHSDHRTLYNTDVNGTAAGAALLAAHETRRKPAPIDMRSPDRIEIPGLTGYAARWRASVSADAANDTENDI